MCSRLAVISNREPCGISYGLDYYLVSDDGRCVSWDAMHAPTFSLNGGWSGGNYVHHQRKSEVGRYRMGS